MVDDLEKVFYSFYDDIHKNYSQSPIKELVNPLYINSLMYSSQMLANDTTFHCYVEDNKLDSWKDKIEDLINGITEDQDFDI